MLSAVAASPLPNAEPGCGRYCIRVRLPILCMLDRMSNPFFPSRRPNQSPSFSATLSLSLSLNPSKTVDAAGIALGRRRQSPSLSLCQSPSSKSSSGDVGETATKFRSHLLPRHLISCYGFVPTKAPPTGFFSRGIRPNVAPRRQPSAPRASALIL